MLVAGEAPSSKRITETTSKVSVRPATGSTVVATLHRASATGVLPFQVRVSEEDAVLSPRERALD
jgi:hypothetical protein